MDKRIVVLVAASFAAGTQAYVFSALLAPMAQELGVQVATMGLLAGGFALCYAVSAPFTSTLLAKQERRRLLLIGLSLLAVLNLAGAFAPNFPGLLALRVLCGVSATLVTPIASAVAAVLAAPERRGRALAAVASGMVIAFLFGMPVGSLIGSEWGWRLTFVFASILCGAVAIAVRMALPQVDPAGQLLGMSALRESLGSSARWGLSITLLAFAATFCVLPYIGPVTQEVTGSSTRPVAAVQMMLGVGSILGLVIGGRVAGRAGARKNLLFVFATIGVTQLGYALLLSQPGLSAAVAWTGLAATVIAGAAAMFALVPIVQADILDAAPRAQQAVLALNGSMVFLGQGLGALVGGYMARDTLLNLGISGAVLAGIGVAQTLRGRTPMAAAQDSAAG